MSIIMVMDIQKLKKKRIELALELARIDQAIAFQNEELAKLKAKIKDSK